MCKILEKGLVGLAPRRKAAGFTQYSFADALGCDRGLVAMYETGRAWPSASRLPAMAALLGCSIDDLYEAPRATSSAADAAHSPQGEDMRADEASAPTDSIITQQEG